MKQVNKNFLYNVIYQILIYIIPLISVPYVSRILGANNIGIYSYTYSIVYYFMLAAMLGINNYGSRVIAKCKDDIKKRSYQFWSIYLLQFILSVIMLIVYSIITFFGNYDYKIIRLIQIFHLLSVLFDINWFYFGLEKFKLTISRNIIIKVLSLFLIFIFVKDSEDLWKYTFIMSFTTLLSQLYLWLHLYKDIEKVKVKIKDIFSHLKKCLILFIPVISYSIYRVMDKTMLGAMSGTLELGYYDNAEKIIHIPISFVTALGTVMIPYMSKNSDNSNDEFFEKIIQSFKLCFFFTIPMVFGLIAIGNDFAVLFFGKEFYKSGILIQTLAISIIFTSVANVIRTNYLIPLEKDKIYVKSTLLGAIFNLSINIVFIPKLGAIGAVVGTIIAEFTVMLLQIVLTYKEIKYKVILRECFGFLLKGLLMFIIILPLGIFIKNKTFLVICQIIVAVVIYVLLNYRYIIYDFFKRKDKSRK